MHKSLHLKFYLLTSRARKNEHPIYCRIAVDRLKTEFFTGYHASKNKWNPEKERVIGNPEVCGMLATIENRLNGIFIEKKYAGVTLSAKEVKDIYFGKDKSKVKLLEYFEIYISEMISLSDQYSIASINKFKTIHRHLAKYLHSISKSEILISGFYLQNVNEFEFFLKTKCNLSVNTTTKYLKILKSIFTRAIQFGYMVTNPYDAFKFKHQKTNRTFLSMEEVKRIENLKTTNHSIEKVRDCFLFSVYTGLRYSDANAITRKNFSKDSEGKYWLEFSIKKTKENLTIPVINKAVEILDKYELESEITGKLLPIISNQKINAYLKIIAELTDLDKCLTYHVSRHTFATTITLSNNIPIEVVSKLLGHSSLESTQIYAKITPEYLSKSTLTLNDIL